MQIDLLGAVTRVYLQNKINNILKSDQVQTQTLV
jgi:hypothetical protein